MTYRHDVQASGLSESAVGGGKVARERFKDRLLSQAASIALGTAMATGMATAATVAITPHAHAQAVGAPVTNPVTGATETVVEIVPAGVITNAGNFIITTVAVGAFIPNPNGSGLVEIESQVVSSGRVVSLKFVGDPATYQVLTPVGSAPGQVAPPVAPVPGASDSGFIRIALSGSRGSNGRGGALFIPATGGGDGGTGPNLPRNLIDPTSYSLGSANISTVTGGVAGVLWSSSGGNGGNGGGSTFNLAGGGKDGGIGGAGGNVTLVLNGGNITTSGSEAHGVVAQSRSGVGGQGGSSFLATGGGGDGGAGNNGGNVSLTVGASTNIRTTGDASVGVFAQSLGGGAGAGGSSYNLFAFGGGAKDGGDGGNVTLSFAGTARTQGLGSHGVFAQSLGGTGGQAGNAGGLLAFGDNGSGGGNGRTVNVTLRSTAFIETDGFGSHGVFGQSVGGGGGSSATSVGLGSFGANGGTGGNGGVVNVTTLAGAQINTLQGFSHGVFAQSVGGGGGSGGTTVGAVSLGAGGGGGGSASNVTVSSAADISTRGIMSRGIFAQSVGGGGGSANASVGLVAIGGNSSDGGSAGNVTVNASGTIETGSSLSNGILAQSVGGGGGDGGMAISGSAFVGLAVGGRGGGGGNSGIVTLNMSDRSVIVGGTPTLVNPTITTRGVMSRGVHLQSVGGGGGNGGLAVQASVGAFGAASFAIGGAGGAGGDGGLVRMFGDLSVQTEGFDADGIVLQSIGGGGGSGGGAVSIALSGGLIFSGSFSLALGGSGGLGGDSLGELLSSDGALIGAGGTRTAVFMDSGGFIGTNGQFSTGLFAQSIGGGGGDGGFSIAAPIAVSESVAVSVGVGVGGSGAGAGAGGRVDVTFDGGIQTQGHDSIGALIQSTGGGGGNGGFNVTASIAGSGVASGAVAVGVGGGAGGGGNGGRVIGRVLQSVATQGDRSDGVVVQSSGGGGGNGGFNVSGNISVSGTAAGGISVGVGGSGGSGGNGGFVTAVADNVTTSGEASTGFLAQSVGGGGGNGGFNVNVGIAGSSTASGAINVGVGGSGGGGGFGSTVNATLQGDVTTSGLNSDGVIAQSLGGGGGNGAFNINAAVAASAGGSGTIGVGVGGSGGGGGTGGAVTLTLDGDQVGEFITVSTGGASVSAESDAILAQSVGGGGGSGGFNIGAGISVGAFGSGNIGVGVGGSGGGGGTGGAVTLRANNGFGALDGMLASTTGARSRAVVAQSVGGGGGNGGFNITGNVAVTYSGGVSGNLGIGVGGSGGGGGSAGAVSAILSGGILTRGVNSGAVEVSSLGGGGGSGAFNITGGVAVTTSLGLSGNIGIGVGGTGGLGGNGGLVSAELNAIIDTFGADSDGAVFQSVGGGGGSGGFNITGGVAVTASSGVSGNIGVGVGGSGGGGGDGGIVNARLTGLVATRQAGSDGVIAQSLGGGGGSGGFNVTGGIGITAGAGLTGSIGVGIGGKGGGGGDAETVTLSVLKGTGLEAALGATSELAVVTTLQDRARGIVAQSLGGSGGSGGFNVTGDINVTAGSGAAGSIGIGVGGFGGDGGSAGTVDLTVVGDVRTAGEDSGAIEATSSGGGGGAGAFNITGGVAVTTGTGATGNIGIGVGGFGGNGGNAGAVSGDVRSDVITTGDTSVGALFQSTGGGGGAGAFNITAGLAITAGSGVGGNIGVGIGGFGGDGGTAGAVDVAFDGTIQTRGLDSTGVMAQSVGGSGGNGAFNITGGAAISKSGAGNLGFGLGGFGGGGGAAGNVTLRMNQREVATGLVISTTRNGARGGVVQSLGGGGGNGAFNITGNLAFSKAGAGNIGIGVGGSAGDGGLAGSATALLNGDIRTEGVDAGAFLLQSVGGGGGNGGFNVSAGISGSKGPSGNLLIGVGGAGGGAGNGGAVLGVFNSNITTIGENSFGLTAQSNGGAGGNGAFNVTGGISLSGNGSGLGAGVLGIGVGGAGGDGGSGGSADVTFTGDISTRGLAAHGALVQSQGGGGGTGAFNITGGIAIANSNSATVGVGVGGFGGAGGNAGIVNGTFSGDVTTRGKDAYGLTLQSVGGGGGSGGFNLTGGLSVTARGGNNAGLNVGIGGFGGGGGNGGVVTGSVTGLYSTWGEDADAVLAQSLGGAGGRGGFNISGGLNLGKGNATALAFGLGGFGGGGGTADAVTLTRVGDTFTRGIQSDGVAAQSIGGGGGSGGFNVTGQLAVALPGASGSSSNHSAAIGIGGFGGAGGSAGAVSLTLTGNVAATGVDDATFREGQTLGQLAETFDFDIASQDRPDLLTAGIDFVRGLVVEDEEPDVSAIEWNQRVRILSNGSNGVMAQSVGGGGGNGAFNIAGNITASTPSESNNSRGLVIGVGGFGGAGGNAANVTLSVSAPTTSTDRVSIVAAGDDRSAVIAQSIGGGGGAGGFNVSGNITLEGSATIGVGGFGSVGGVAGDVTATVDADLFAQGSSARGLLAQSVGGGGGAGGFNIAAGVTGNPNTDESSITIGVGGGGGVGNESGDVDVTQNGQILVDGFNAVGLLAQSVGGGGGAGAFNVAVNANLGGSNAGNTNPLKGYSASVGVGGTGGGGADAGDVSVRSTGNIIINYASSTDPTTGDPVLEATEFSGYNIGLHAQSVGGGGGTGGINVSGVLARQGNPLGVSVGGSGGSSGDGGSVSVIRGYTASGAAPGTIQLSGDNSVGLSAESIGGGGGRAGATFLLTGSKKDVLVGTPLGANIIVGGNGGGAGSGGSVTVDHYGNILMSGNAATGLMAQSVGGGGGNADIAIGTGYTADTSSLNLTVGGAPTAGGTGGDVNVTHVGRITTDGDDSLGILAQSIGGGGGNTALSMALVFGQDDQLSITVGRAGGVGGDSGDVTVDFGDRDARRDPAIAGGSIQTTGDRSTAIFAQAVGGGGGISSATSVVLSGTENAGNPANEKVHQVGVSVGADGPNGGVGGNVNVFADGLVTTEGYEAHGIHAQSLGGGGGRAGAAMRPTINASSAFNIAVGGTGGNAGTGGNIMIDSVAFVETEGERADGIRAESIGGGGGSGGYAVSLGLNFPFFSILTPAKAANTVNLNFGGDGGQGATGGDITVLNGGFVRTNGIEAHGIAARSIGGGGGEGGMAFTGRMSTSGESNSFDLNVGGSGDVGGDAGNVTVDNRGVVVTLAERSHGVLAHSIGGGGGSAGIVGNIDFSRAGGTDNERNSITINIGGSGGDGGVGGAVRVTNRASTDPTDPTFGVPTGVIETRGNNAHGVFAQSIGGGGGNGASVISIAGTNATVGTGDEKGTQLSFSLGGAGGVGGIAGAVDVINDGLIQTFGDDSHAILAQSIGGGGGTGGFALAGTLSLSARANAPVFAIGGSGGDGGASGAVTVTNTGELRTSGARSHGIVAQSIGGGGGNSQLGLALSGEPISLAISSAISALVGGLNQSSGGQGGDVVVNQNGNIVVTGDGAVAIKAESINGGGGGLAIDFTNLASFTGTPLSVSGPGGVGEREFGVNLGGQGSQEQNAGRVTINTDGDFVATGRFGAASRTSSVGGGGGSYDLWVQVETPAATTTADASTAASTPAPGTSVDINIAMGGNGGIDNDGGDLITVHTGSIMSDGLGTLGVFEQSVGGGGGQSTVVIDVPAASPFSNYMLQMGGENGLRERGGDIARVQSGVVATLGDAGLGALLQSVGGGGGYGFANFAGAGTTALEAIISFGATGGSELSGGNVAGTFQDSVMSTGFGAHGALLQSIGAGGGFATVTGGASLEVAFGGVAGASGDGADAELRVDGAIVTEGAGALGALAQSIGGGGGAVLTDINPGDVSVAVNQGGAGDGGAVTASVGGSLQTLGDGAIGVAAQSIGGGGGFVIGLAPAVGPDADALGLFAGSAGGAGDGGSVAVSVDGDVVTSGDRAFGLYAQSAGGDAGDVDIDVTGSIVTNGAATHAVMLQSIGGSGGLVVGDINGPAELRDGLSAGDGGSVSFTLGGNIVASGEGSNGLVIQSLGGGGGWFESDFAGSAGGVGSGGAISAAISGQVWATTENANAIFLQSLGRDGGGDILALLANLVRGGSGFGAGMVLDGGANNHVQILGSLSAVSGLALDATTGNDFIENSGLFVGNVDLGSGINSFNNNEDATFIAFSTIDLRDPAPADYLGRTLQTSPGLTTSSLPVVADTAATGSGATSAGQVDAPVLINPQSGTGDVSNDPATGASSAPVVVTGADLLQPNPEPAISAVQTDGPFVATVQGSGVAEPSVVSVFSGATPQSHSASVVSGVAEPLNGSVVTGSPAPAGAGGDVVQVLGTTALPISAEPAGDVTVALATNMTPEPDAAPIAVAMPVAMSVQGEVEASVPMATTAPVMPAAPETFTNAGNFVMGLSAPRFPIDLLNGDTFGNLDAMGDPTTNLLFGARVINTVELDGNYVQTGTGHLVFDVAFGPYASDMVNVTGDTTVDGTGEVILTWLESDENRTLFATEGTAIDNGLEIEDTLAVDFGIEANEIGIQLTMQTDFGQDFLNENGQALGGHIDSAIRADGSAGIGRLGALLGNLQAGQEDVYSAIFTELDASGHLAPVHAQLDNAQAFADALFSCESPVRQVDGQCVWTRLEASASTRSETFETFSVEADAFHFRGGFEQRMDNPIWTMAAAIGYDDLGSFRIDDTRWRAQGQALHAGLGFERTSPTSGTIVGAGVTTGWQWTDAVRNQNIFEPGTGESSATSGYVTTELHVAQVLRSGRVFARPEMRGTITALHHTGMSETGLDGLGVEVLSDTQMVAALSPEVALGVVLHEAAESAATLTVTFGADFQSTDRLALPMRLLGANPMADPAMIGTALDQESYRISTDLHLVGNDRLGLRFGYTAEFGDHVEDHRAGFDFRAKF